MEIKENKIKLNTLQNGIVLNSVFLVIMIIVYFTYVSGMFDIYNQNKDLLTASITKYENINKNGLDYDSYKSTASDKDTTLVLNKMGKNFFDKNFKNTISPDYLTYLSKKTQEIFNQKSDPNIVLRSQKIDKVLPAYAKGIVTDGNMSDLQFVNYVETLLRSFNLVTTSKIGISDVIAVNDDTQTNPNGSKKVDSLSTQIFYIPLNLELDGAKSDIVDFLYFIQNVGVINSITNNQISFYNDDVLAGKTIIGQQNTSGYNIYENKIIDISSFSIKDYIDTSSALRDQKLSSVKGFVDFIKKGDEASNSYKVTLDLKFYVKGLPLYTLDSFIQNVIKKYKEVSLLSKKTLTEAQSKKELLLKANQVDIISSLKSIDLFLTENAAKSKEIEVGTKQKDNLESVYQKATQFNYDLINVQNVLNLNVQKIKNIKK